MLRARVVAIAVAVAVVATAFASGTATAIGPFNRPTVVSVKWWIARDSAGAAHRIGSGDTYTHCGTVQIVRLSIKAVGRRTIAGKPGSFRSIVARDGKTVLRSQVLFWKSTRQRNRFGLHYDRANGFADGRWTWTLVQRAGARTTGRTGIALATDPTC